MSSASRAAEAGPRYPASAFPVSLRPVAFTPMLTCRKCPPRPSWFTSSLRRLCALRERWRSKAPAQGTRHVPVCRGVGDKLLGPSLCQEISDLHPPLALLISEPQVAVGVAGAGPAVGTWGA